MTFSTESNSQILLGSELATQVVQDGSTPLAVLDLQNRPGWYYNSSSPADNFVWTIFNGTDQNYTLDDVQNLTFTATHDNLPDNKCYIAISSTAGSKIAYKNDNVDLIPGEKCLFYTNNVPQNPDQLRLVQLNPVIISGLCLNSEQLSTITLEGTNVGFSDNSLQVCVENIGYLLSSNTVHIISSLIADKSIPIILDSVKIKATNGDNITATTGSIHSNITNTSLNTHCYASYNGTTWHQLSSDANGQLNVHSKLQDGSGTDITSTLNGDTKQSLDVNVSNSSIAITDSAGNGLTSIDGALNTYLLNTSVEVIGDFFQETQPVSIASNVGIKDSAGNSLTSTSNNLDVNMKAFNRTNEITSNLTTVAPNGATSSKALETYSYMVGLNTVFNVPLQITSTSSRDTTQSLDVQIQNGSTTIFNSGTGLNVYQILPKIKQYTIGGYDEQSSVYRLFGLATPGGINTTATNFGLANPRVHYGGTSGGTYIVAYIDFVNYAGDLVENAGPYAFNSPIYAILPEMIAPIKFRLISNLAAGQAVYISIAQNSSVNAVAGQDQNQYCIGTFTVPNDYIGYISHLSSNVSATTNIQIVKWDVNGIRSVVYRFNNTGNADFSSGYEGSLGGIFYAGETVAFSNQTAVAGKSCFANMILKSLV